MSLFLPSNLSPNFEEVNPSGSFNFSFQVNTNGSCVRSYKLEILNDKNDADIPEDNILATFYGIFETPLYNKDIYTIVISDDDMSEALGDNSLVTTKDYRWRIRLYEDEIASNAANGEIVNIQTVYGSTYVGAGHTVGTTKNVIWLNRSNERIVEDKYIQTTLYSDDKNNDFNPFNVKHLLKHDDYITAFEGDTVQKGCIVRLHTNQYNKIDGFEIDQNDILPEYRKKIADGNMYFMPYPIINDDQLYHTHNLPKRIIGFENTNDESLATNCIIKIDPLQAYDSDKYTFSYNNVYLYKLVYIQRQQIYAVSNSIGTHQLTKIELDEPMDYNTFHGTTVETGLVSDDFDYGRVYIDPVQEFDSKLVPSAYINIAYSDDQLIDVSASNEYKLLESQPNDWESDCEKYFQKFGEYYVMVKKEYYPINTQPDDWLANYTSYYNVQYIQVKGVKDESGKTVAPPWPTSHDGDERNYIYYRYDSEYGYTLIEDDQSAPDDWETNYSEYFEITDKYVQNTSPEFIQGLHYEYQSPSFREYTYYSYGISQMFLSQYNNSLACVQLTNYVSKTGECSLFSDLTFKPDRHYMYQIFIVDQNAPNYNAANSSNPYKFFAGTRLSNGYIHDRYYLGGYNGDLTENISTRSNLLSIYSNHRVGQTNQFLCFIQPNSGIFEDQYKPCTLQLYNNKCQNDLYITNYNGSNEYNKDYSIDTLDDSQWLVALTYPNIIKIKTDKIFNLDDNISNKICTISAVEDLGSNNGYDIKVDFNDSSYCICDRKYFDVLPIPGDKANIKYNRDDNNYYVTISITQVNQSLNNELISLIQKPQTKYKIYTNFVNSIPEAYFYYRDNKHLQFNFYDFYREELLPKGIVDRESGQFTIIRTRDILVRCDISDATEDGDITNRNVTTIKSYKYTVAEIDQTVDLNSPDCIIKIVYNSGLIYDSRYQYGIRGLEKGKYYRIQIDAEDEYGFVHTWSEDVYFDYNYDRVNDRISAEIDCEKQAIHIDFSPVKLFSGVGNINKDNSNDGYVAIDDTNGLLFESLQDNAQNKISIPNDFVMYTKFSIGEDILATEAEHPVFSVETDGKNKYNVTFDTRTYIKNDSGIFSLNDKYLQFKCVREGDINPPLYFDTSSIFSEEYNYPMLKFEYMISTEDENTAGIYVVAENDQQFKDINNNLGSYSVGKKDSDGKNEIIYENNGNKINEVNKQGIVNVELYIKLCSQGGATSFCVSDSITGLNMVGEV